MRAKGGWRFWAFAVVLPSAVLGVVAGALAVSWLLKPEAAAGTAPAPVVAARAPDGRAVQLIERAARGQYTDALTLTAPDSLTKEILHKRIGEFAPTVTAAHELPNEQMLVWVTYARAAKRLHAHYLITMSDAGITAVEGPFAPMNGYGTFDLDIYAEDGHRIQASSLRGQGLILVAPRRPNPDLPPLLEELRQEAERGGARFILAMDTAAPAWDDYARSQGYNGPIWRVKGNLERFPTISAFPFQGMVGILVDRSGLVVAPFSVVEPVRYGRPDEELTALLPTILKAYGLTPN